jgi:hypothetical protein
MVRLWLGLAVAETYIYMKYMDFSSLARSML